MFQFILVIIAAIFLLFAVVFTIGVLCRIFIEKISAPSERWIVAIAWMLFYICHYLANLS